MLYSEYLRCAEKHLKSCKAFLSSYQPNKNNDFEVFMELFYITWICFGRAYCLFSI